ncbi:hypothetical protein, conserved [Eimeria necatrix]|uniref:Uncharacterized protein n=1 Tax=Eimeria necatrix TaxID=51315 RepID=U6N8K9_9EIME|nr:hypothetical protein, conserved [Eimeria necatrix]CDJ70206.1 hypothetical protein, conserved [Eimeria necatrix]
MAALQSVCAEAREGTRPVTVLGGAKTSHGGLIDKQNPSKSSCNGFSTIISESDSTECIEESEGCCQREVEESFSVFDEICRFSLSSTRSSRSLPATQTAMPLHEAIRTKESDSGVVSGTFSDLPVLYPSSKTKEGPAVLLAVLRELADAGVRTPQAWGPPLLLILKQLPLLSVSELHHTVALLAAAGCRPPLLLQGLCEAFSWRAAAKSTDAKKTVLFLDALRRLRYLPSERHLTAFLGSLERRRKPLTVGDLLKIQRFVDELGVPPHLASAPFFVSILPQLKRNIAALKPPEAAALASLLLKRKELNRDTAESLSTAVYEHLGGTSSFLLLQQRAASMEGTLQNSLYTQWRNISEGHEQTLQQRRERVAFRSSLASLLHLGKSLASADLKQFPVAYSWALEREIELHWSAMAPAEVSAVLRLLARMKYRPTSALNKLGVSLQRNIHLYTPDMLCVGYLDGTKPINGKKLNTRNRLFGL